MLHLGQLKNSAGFLRDIASNIPGPLSEWPSDDRVGLARPSPPLWPSPSSRKAKNVPNAPDSQASSQHENDFKIVPVHYLGFGCRCRKARKQEIDGLMIFIVFSANARYTIRYRSRKKKTSPCHVRA